MLGQVMRLQSTVSLVETNAIQILGETDGQATAMTSTLLDIPLFLREAGSQIYQVSHQLLGPSPKCWD